MSTETASIASINQWRSLLGAPSRVRVCGVCDVSWDKDSDEHCWVCGRAGDVAFDLMRAAQRRTRSRLRT